ncbi:MAG TPA: ABC transporter permease subunit [Verrucomicrobiae bacterium]|jgi:sodium transport system permease protein|nr:ABC transporter permease subunit [Verrucomicrobiae bacterium]
MSLNPIRVVYFKEIRDLLRDRRTIISMIVVPMIVMPTLIVAISKMASTVVGQARHETAKVMLLGGEDSPATVAALHKLKTIQFAPVSADYTNQISEKKIGAAVEIPPGFDAALAGGASAPNVRIYTYEGDLKSGVAAESLEQFFRQRKDEVVSRRLGERNVSTAVLTPFSIARTNVASPKKLTGNLLGMILPYMVILMCMTGAIYPSVDLTAGEKERGTLETLLCSPVPRTQLVLGKVLVVLTVSVITALLSIFSNGVALLMIRGMTAGVARGKSAAAALALDPTSLAGVAVMMIPMAVFISALMVAAGLFARSSKEANSYVQPLLFLAILPAAAGGLPGVEMNYRLAFIPVFNVSLISKEILSGLIHWNYILMVFGVMTVYAILAIIAAVLLFNRETVLFRT